MDIIIAERTNLKRVKTYYSFEWGKGKGERKATGIFTFTKPKDAIQRHHNDEMKRLLLVKKAELLLEMQSAGSSFLPAQKVNANFLTFYEEYIRKNKKQNKRHLEASFKQFKSFLKQDYIPAPYLTEEVCLGFRDHLLARLNGDSPANYFSSFKRVIKAAAKVGYFKESPCADIKAKTNPSKRLRENLEVDEYIQLCNTPFYHGEVRDAFIFCCYTGLRHCDVKKLSWEQINGDTLDTRIIQHKTGKELIISLHPIAKKILETRKKRRQPDAHSNKVFKLPTVEGSNKILLAWMKVANIEKHITWHCARLSFSILLQDKRVDAATVALLLGHTSTRYVDRVYKRHRPKDFAQTLEHLPMPAEESSEKCSSISLKVISLYCKNA